MWNKFKALAWFVMPSLLIWAQPDMSKCHYGKNSLTGILVVEKKYGAPGFEKDGASKRIRVYFLRLDSPISISPLGEDVDKWDKIDSIDKIRLMSINGFDVARLKELVGKRVSIEGILEGATVAGDYSSAVMILNGSSQVKLFKSK